MSKRNVSLDNVRLLTAEELGQFLGVSISTVRRMVKDQQIPVVRVRGTVRFNPAAVETVLTNIDQDWD